MVKQFYSPAKKNINIIYPFAYYYDFPLSGQGCDAQNGLSRSIRRNLIGTESFLNDHDRFVDRS